MFLTASPASISASSFLPLPRVVAFVRRLSRRRGALVLLRHTDTGKAIRAVAKERYGATLIGIDVAHIYAVTFGIGAACIAVAACLLLPSYYVQSARRRGLCARRLHRRRASAAWARCRAR